MDVLSELYRATQDSMIANLGYDLTKIVIGFILARILVDRFYMNWRWGGWNFIVMNDKDVIGERKISPATAKRIRSDDTELSVYAKGVVSPHTWLNVDLGSKEAWDLGVLELNKKAKTITCRIDKNPQKPKQPSRAEIYEKTQEIFELISRK